jgi:cardiolipin synthase
MPDASFLLAMRMAAERGVEVHLIVSDRSNKPIVQLAQESNYDGLLEAGVRIHRYFGNFLHAKHATIDADIALIGSSNLDNRSFALNNEVSVLVYDRAVVAELASIQARYLAASHTVEASQWVRRSIARKILQNIARLTDTLI